MKLKNMKANVNISTPKKLYAEVSTIIARPPDVVYSFMRELPNLQLVMFHLKSVRILDEVHSEWIVKTPGGIFDLRWEAEIIKDIPGEYIEWTTIAGSTIEHTGFIKFNKSRSGTKIEISISYKTLTHIEGLKVPLLLNKIIEEIIHNEIRGLKHYLETTKNIQKEDYESNKKDIRNQPKGQQEEHSSYH
jgi:uncharacterized membrane protein